VYQITTLFIVALQY